MLFSMCVVDWLAACTGRNAGVNGEPLLLVMKFALPILTFSILQLSKLFGKKEMRILMVGLDAAGKTTILYKYGVLFLRFFSPLPHFYF